MRACSVVVGLLLALLIASSARSDDATAGAQNNQPQAGEIGLTGTVQQNYPATHLLVLNVTALVLPSGEVRQAAPAAARTIMLKDDATFAADNTSGSPSQKDLKPGAYITLIGKESGKNGLLWARLAFIHKSRPSVNETSIPLSARDDHPSPAPVSSRRKKALAIVSIKATHESPSLVAQLGASQWVAAAVSPDAALVAGCNIIGPVYVYDAETGQLKQLLFDPQKNYSHWSLTFSPNGKLLASLGTEGLTIYNVESGTTEMRFSPIEDGKNFPFSGCGHCLQFSADSNLLAGACLGGVAVWNMRSRALQRALTVETNSVPQNIALRLDGRQVAAADLKSDLIRVWNLDSGDLVSTLHNGSPVESLALSGDGRFVAAAAGATLKVWKLESGALVYSFQSPDKLRRASFASNDTEVFAMGDSMRHAWNLATGEVSREQKGGVATFLIGDLPTPFNFPVARISTDAASDLCAVANGTAGLSYGHVGDAESLKSAGRPLNALRSTSFSPDGKYLAIRSYNRADSSTALGVWDLTTGRMAAAFPAKYSGTQTFSADGQRLAVFSLLESGKACELRVIDLTTSRTLWSHDLADQEGDYAYDGIYPLAFDATGHFVALGRNQNWDSKERKFRGSEIVVWNSDTGDTVNKLTLTSAPLENMAFAMTGTHLAAVVNNAVILWDIRRQQYDIPGELPHDQVAELYPNLATTPTMLAGNGIFSFAAQGAHRDPRNVQSPDSILCASADGSVLVIRLAGVRIAISTRTSRIKIENARTGDSYIIDVGHEVGCCSMSADGKRIAVGSNDGLVSLYDLATHRHIATFLGVNGNADWLATTPQGYYDCSLEASNFVDWKLDNQFFPFDHFEAKFRRPDLLRKALAGEDITNAPALQGNDIPPAVVFTDLDYDQIVTPDAHGALTMSLNAAGVHPIARVELTLNGRPLDAALARRLEVNNPVDKERDFTLTMPVPPNQPRLRLRAVAYDTENLRSFPAEISLRVAGARETPGDLYLLGVGVTRYRNNEYNLKYADADAIALMETLEQRNKGLYAKVQRKVLTSEQATVSNMLFALRELKDKATENDTVVVFISGHGVRDDLGRYYFATYEADADAIARTMVDWEQFVAILKEVRARRLILLADTCHAGSITGRIDTDVLTDRLNKSAGVVVYSASRGDELSFEQATWGHGAFTKALLEGLDGVADADKDGKLTLSELRGYVTSRVAALTNDRQHPYLPRLQQFEPGAVIAILP